MHCRQGKVHCKQVECTADRVKYTADRVKYTADMVKYTADRVKYTADLRPSGQYAIDRLVSTWVKYATDLRPREVKYITDRLVATGEKYPADRLQSVWVSRLHTDSWPLDKVQHRLVAIRVNYATNSCPPG